MKVLVDECVPKPLLKRLHGHTFNTAQDMGWAGIKNGKLLALAISRFDHFLTSDRNLRYQQDLRSKHLAVLVLSTNLWPALRPCAKLVQAAVDQMKPGMIVELVIPEVL